MTSLSHPAAPPVSAPATAKAPTTAARASRSGPLAELAGLLAIAALVPLRDAWVVQALSLLLLFTVPGAILLRALRVPRVALGGFPVYVPAASVAVLIGVSLAVDLLGLALGIDAPLRPVPLLVGLEVVGLLLLVAGAKAPAHAGVAWRLPAARPSELWPLVLPLLSAAGAFQLTYGHGNVLAMVGLVATIGALLVGIVVGNRLGSATLRLLAFGVATSLLWSFSLRGTFVFGYDISTEFHVLDSTIGSGSWHAVHHDDAYGAMLSLTTLPALMHALAGASSLLLLKAVYPLACSLFAVGVLDLARRYVTGRFAVIAVAMIVAQTYFFQQMPAIARQEIALLAFIALVAVVLDPTIGVRRRIGPIAAFTLAMSLSHYSTTYLAVGMFGVGLIGAGLLRLIRRRVSDVGPIAIAFVIGAIGAGLWYGAITDSGQNVTRFSDSLRDQGFQILPNRGPNEGVLSAYLNGNNTAKVSASKYQQLIGESYAKDRAWVRPLGAGSDPRYALRASRLPATAEDVGARAMKPLATLTTQGLNVLAVVTILLLLFLPAPSPRLRTIALLGGATLAALTVLRLSGTAANAYNQERAFVQSTVLLAVTVAIAAQWLSNRHRIVSWLVAASAVVGLFCVIGGGTGLRSELFGGAPSVNVANAGEDYERFYSRSSELSAARWLQGEVPPGGVRYADGYGQLRVLAASGSSHGLLTGVTPSTIDRRAWVYGSTTNLVTGRARGTIDRNFATYAWPAAFLETNYNKVFSNGGAAVYHR